jgi:hypothetical protein
MTANASAEDLSESGLTDDGGEDRGERGKEVVGAGRPGGGGDGEEERHERRAARGDPSPPCRELHLFWLVPRALRSPRTRGGGGARRHFSACGRRLRLSGRGSWVAGAEGQAAMGFYGSGPSRIDSLSCGRSQSAFRNGARP